MYKQPLLIMLLCFMAGIIVADGGYIQVQQLYLAVGFGLVLLVPGFIKKYWLQKFRPAFLAVFFFGIGALTLHLHMHRPMIKNFSGRQTFIFTLEKKLNSSEKYRRYEVIILKVRNGGMAAAPQAPRQETAILPFKAVVSVKKAVPPLDFRHRYQADAYLNAVEAPDNDFQFNYARYLSRKQIFYQAFINKQPLKAEKLSLSLSDKIRQRRLDILLRIDQSALAPKTREFLKGIILADRTEMDAGTVADFSRSGLVHLLAISGSHMVIIFGIILFLFKTLLPFRFHTASIVASLVAIWSFAVLIDYGSSVVRSCIMISAFYLYVLLQRKPDLLHAMALAAFLILIFDPHQLFDVGFQLSFVAVLGIFLLNRPLLSFFGNLTSKPKRFFANVFSVSLSAQLATLPLVLYYFHQYSALSVVANLVVIPFSEIIIVLSLLMCVLLAFNIEFQLADAVFDRLVEKLLNVIHWFATKDFAFGENIAMSVLEALLLMVPVYFLREFLLKKDLRSTLRLASVCLFFLIVRMGLNFFYLEKVETVLTKNFSNKILIVKQGGVAKFYIKDPTETSKIRNYIIVPYLARARISDFTIHRIPEGSKTVAVNGKVYDVE